MCTLKKKVQLSQKQEMSLKITKEFHVYHASPAQHLLSFRRYF